jgi:hypothetical protein
MNRNTAPRAARRATKRARIVAASLLSVALAAAIFAAAGCSDDVTCPEPGPEALYVSGLLEVKGDGRGESTRVEVFCSADPRPDTLVVLVNLRTLAVEEAPGGLGFVATLEDTVVIWQPGTECLLKVIPPGLFASSTVALPSSFAVTAPAQVALGETLRVFWDPSEDADYYVVSAILDGGSRDQVELSATVAETSVTFLSADLPFPGDITGRVEAIAGPFPDGGSEGNVTGDGWGFFRASYRDAASAFEVEVTD